MSPNIGISIWLIAWLLEQIDPFGFLFQGPDAEIGRPVTDGIQTCSEVDHFHKIKTVGDVRTADLPQIGERRPVDPAFLGRTDPAFELTRPFGCLRPAGLDLGEYQTEPVTEDQIDLTLGHPVIAQEDVAAEIPVHPFGCAFTCRAEAEMGGSETGEPFLHRSVRFNFVKRPDFRLDPE